MDHILPQNTEAASQPAAVSRAIRVWKPPAWKRMPRAQKPSTATEAWDSSGLVQMVSTSSSSMAVADSTNMSRAFSCQRPS